MSQFAGLLGEVIPALERIIARRALDRLLTAAGLRPPESLADEAEIDAIGERLRESFGADMCALRRALDEKLAALPCCLSACLKVGGPEFAAVLRPLAESTRRRIVERLTGRAT